MDMEAGQRAQQIRAFVAFAEELGSVPSTHRATSGGSDTLSWILRVHVYNIA